MQTFHGVRVNFDDFTFSEQDKMLFNYLNEDEQLAFATQIETQIPLIQVVIPFYLHCTEPAHRCMMKQDIKAVMKLIQKHYNGCFETQKYKSMMQTSC